MRKTVSALLTVIMMLIAAAVPVGAYSSSDDSYKTYFEGLEVSEKEFEKDIIFQPANSLLSYGAGFNTDGYISFSADESSAEISFNTDEKIAGYIELTYIPLVGGSYISSSVGIEVNGSYSFDESRELSLNHRWKQGERKEDERGNEILSSAEAISEETVALLSDPTGRRNDPLIFSFDKGENRLKITAHTGNFTLCKIRLLGMKKTKIIRNT